MKMMFSKLLNIVLAVVLLCSLLLVSVKTSTSGNSVTSNGAYDPWVDVNGDGIINILDATAIGYAWLAQGDPTRNVNITNWPQDRWELRLEYNESVGELVQSQYKYITSINVAGYKIVTLYAKINGTFMISNGYLEVVPYFNAYGIINTQPTHFDIFFGDTISTGNSGSASFEIYGPKLDIYLYGFSNTGQFYADVNLLTIAVYLQN
jgi:hypothetical protein